MLLLTRQNKTEYKKKTAANKMYKKCPAAAKVFSDN